MKINDLDKLLEEGRHEEAVDMLLKEIGEEEGTKVVEEPVNEPNEEAKEAKLETPEVEEEAKEEEKSKEDKEEKHKDEEEKSEEAEENKEESEEKEDEVKKEEIKEDTMEVEPAAIDAVKDGTAEIEDLLSDDNGNADELKEVPAGETVEQAEEILDKKVPEVDIDTQISESLNSIFALLRGLNEEAGNEATEEKQPEAETPKVETEDVFPTEEHKEAEEIKEPELENEGIYNKETEPVAAEEVKEVVVESAKIKKNSQDTGMSHIVTQYEYYDDDGADDGENRRVVITKKSVDHADGSEEILHKEDRVNKGKSNRKYGKLAEETENVATEEREPEAETPELENEDIYNKETEPVDAEEVKEVVVEDYNDTSTLAGKIENQLTRRAVKKDARIAFAPKGNTVDKVTQKQKAAEARDEHLIKTQEIKGKYTENPTEISSPTVEYSNHHETKFGSIYKEEVKVDATEAREPEVKKQDLENKDIYCDVMHKQVEDIVAVVVEAAKLCKEAGVAGTIENITEMAKSLFEAEEVTVKVEKPENEPKEEEYDVDASIESSEMNGNKEEFEKYEEIQGEGSEAAKAEESVVEPKDLQETVKYTSLKEACMLDEAYFTTDSYSIQTAAEKQAKLTEQVALLLARESADPLYNELLKNSVYCRRLQEALLEKYSDEAAVRSSKILGK